MQQCLQQPPKLTHWLQRQQLTFTREIKKESKSEHHYLMVSKFFTLVWGLIAISFASFGTLFENLIQLVNIIGSIFYGTVLGIFLVAFFFKKVGGNSIFYAAHFTSNNFWYLF